MKKVIHYIFVLGLIIIINSPSIKMFYSSELINIVGFFLIISSFLYRIFFENLIVHKNIIRLISSFSIFFLLLFLSALWSPIVITLIDILKYLQVFILFVSILLALNKMDLSTYIKWQISWSTILAISHLFGIVKTNLTLGQHYLTVGLPLGLGLVGILGQSWELVNSKNKIRLFLYSICALIIAGDLFSLRGRSPILMFVLVIYLFGLLIVLLNPNRTRNLIILLIISIVIYILFKNFTGDILMDRFTNLFKDVESEPRYALYRYTINLIKRNPLGYGLGSFAMYTGSSYPHNIFLEVIFYGGIQSLLFVLPIFLNMIITSVIAVKEKKQILIVISMMAIYVFLVWNISFDLTSSYVVFSIIAIQLGAGGFLLGGEHD
ncbi:hypothetical protein [Aerococcus urinaeequi]|uniref:hypothetical protein n=1 Tax=Aerococcus urinaeequi TaxID=51665 RepID=UPI003ED8AF82